MNTLKSGSRGPEVQLLQLALERAGYSPGTLDGVFGSETAASLRSFERANGFAPDGIAGGSVHRALMPYYTGYVTHTVKRGDTLYNLSQEYGVTLRAVETANPGVDPLNLAVGSVLTVPLPFPVVPDGIAYCSALIGLVCRGIAARYPFVSLGEIGKSVMGAPLWTLTLGTGENRLFYNAAHHANEWITTPLLLKFCEELAHASAFSEKIYGFDAESLLKKSTLCLAPAVNPDGIDLVTGALRSGAYYDRAVEISRDYPDIPFPSGWKANILGTDLNLQYPAGWSQAQEIKFAQGYISPAPRDFVGYSPLSARESRSIYEHTLSFSPALTLSYHTQGNPSYWRYLDCAPPRSREIANLLAAASGYVVEDTPYSSGFAGYKDWFIQNFFRPGYTIEAGSGENPLPLSRFSEIYNDNIGILTLPMTLTELSCAVCI